MQRELTTAEVSELLSRNYDLARRVSEHKIIVAQGGWSQVTTAGGWLSGLLSYPIPPGGLAVHDDKFGAVIVFPDAAGALHFNADVASSAVNAVNLPPYESPTGNTMTQTLSDIEAAAHRLLTGLLIGLVVVGCVWVFVNKKA